MFPCLCVFHTDCSHDSNWMVTLHVSSSEHWFTQGCQCRTPVFHVDATHSSSNGLKFLLQIKKCLVCHNYHSYDSKCIRTCITPVTFTNTDTGIWIVQTLIIWNSNITSTCSKGKTVKGYTLVNVFLATQVTFVTTLISKYNHNFIDGVLY